MKNVVVVGSINLDLTITMTRLPAPGETVLGNGSWSAGGGKGANQAMACALQGVPTSLIGCVGNDEPGTRLLAELDERVDLTHVRRNDVPTGLATILVDAGGGNMIVVAPLANSELTIEDVQSAAPTIGISGIVLANLESPPDAVAEAFRIGRRGTARTVLNASPASVVDGDLLSLADVIVINESEAQELAGTPVTDPATARSVGRLLHERTASTIVITLGAMGAMCVDGSEARHVPAPIVQAVDTTAAGDAFCGTLVARLAQGATLIAALRSAVAAGAYAVTVQGAQPSLPDFDDVQRILHGVVP